MIIRFPTGNTIGGDFEVTKDNVGDGYVHGVELSGDYRFHPQWTVFTGLSWMYGEVDTYPTAAQVEESEPLDRLMPPSGHLGLRWDHPSGQLWVEGLLDFADEADELSTRDKSDTSRIPSGGTPGYQVLSFYAGWQPSENISLNLALENVFDEDYRIHGSGLNEPGRNLIAQLEYRF
jgi:hemoglobin/transferrin/lactoferrin receptor protein